MINQFVEKFIDKYLNKWLKDFRKKKVNISLSQAEFQIENVILNPSVFTIRSNLLRLQNSFIESFSLRLPLTNIATKQPEIIFNDVTLCFKIESKNNWNFDYIQDFESKLDYIINFRENFINELKNITEIKSNQKNNDGFVKRFLVKILKKLTINIKNLKIKINSDLFTAAITLDQIELNPIDMVPITDISIISAGLTHQRIIKLTNLQVYLEPIQSSQYNNNDNNIYQSQFSSNGFINSNSINSLPDIPNDNINVKLRFDNTDNLQRLCCISTEIMIYYRDFRKLTDISRTKFVLCVPIFQLTLSSSQIQTILNFISLLDYYRNEVNSMQEHMNYKLLKPDISIIDAKKNLSKSKIIASWWKYAAWSALHAKMLKMNKSIEYNHNTSMQFLHKTLFLSIYRKFIQKSELKSLSTKDYKNFEEIIKSYPYSKLIHWVKHFEIKEYLERQSKSMANTKNIHNEKSQIKKFLKQKAGELFGDDEIDELQKIIEKSIQVEENLENEMITIEKESLKTFLTDDIIKHECDIKIEELILNIKDSNNENEFGLALNLQKLESSIIYSTKFIRIKSALRDCTLAYTYNHNHNYKNNTYYNNNDLQYRSNKTNFEIQSSSLSSQSHIFCHIERKDINDSFVKIIYEIPLTIMQGYSSLNVEITSIHFYYNPWIVNKIRNMFNLKETDEKAKVIAWNQFEKISDSSKEKFKSLMNTSQRIFLNIKISSPKIIIKLPIEPYPKNLIHNQNEELIFHAGDLEIKNCENRISHLENYYAATSNKTLEENFSLKLDSICLIHKFNDDKGNYVPIHINHKITNKHSSLHTSTNSKDSIMTILEPLNLSILFNVMYNISNNRMNIITINSKIEDIKMNLSPKIVLNIINLINQVKQYEENLTLVEEKQYVYRKAINQSHLYFKTKNMKKWHIAIVLICGLYMYCYDNQDSLYPLFRIYLDDISISKVDNPIDSTSKEYIIEIIAKDGRILYFHGNDQNEINVWMKILIHHMKNMRLNVHDNHLRLNQRLNLINKKINENTCISTLQNSFKIIFEIKNFHLKIMFNQLNDYLDIFIKNFQANINMEPNLQKMLIMKLDSIAIMEAQLINQKSISSSRTLLRTYELKDDTTIQHPIEIKMLWNQPSSSSLSEDVIESIMEINSEFCSIIWKPELLYKLRQLISDNGMINETSVNDNHLNHDISRESGFFSQQVNQTKDQQQHHNHNHNNIQNDNMTTQIMKLNFAKLQFILEINNLNMNHIDAKNLIINTQITPQQFELEGSIDTLKIFDCTEYPKTYKKRENYATARKTMLFSGENNEKILKFSYISLKNSQESHINYNINNNNNNNNNKPPDVSLLNLEFSPFELCYMQQPILRLISYYQECIMEPLFPWIPNDEILKETQEKQLNTPPSILEMRITMANPKIYLYPIPYFERYFELDIGYIVINNTYRKDTTRAKKYSKIVFIEDYKIQLSGINMILLKGNEREIISSEFGFLLNFERLLYTPEYLSKYPDIDNRYQLYGEFTNICLKFRREEYLLLLSILYGNINHDDYCDRLYVRSYTKSLGAPTTVMKIHLNIPILAFYMLLPDNKPSVNINLKGMNIHINREKNSEYSIKILNENITSCIYEEIDSKRYKKLWVLGDIKPMEIQNSEFIHSEMDYKNYERAFFLKSANKNQLFRDSPMVSHKQGQEKKYNFNIIIELKKTYEKIINVNLMNTSLLFFLDLKDRYSNFFYFDEDLELYKQTDTLPVVTHITFQLKTEDVLIFIPSSNLTSGLCLKGELSFAYVRNFRKINELTYNIFSEKDHDNNLIINNNNNNNNNTENIYSKIMFHANNISLYLSHDILKDMKEVKRMKNIITPFSIFLDSKTLNINKAKNYFKSKMEVVIERATSKLSFRECNIIQKIMKWQLDRYNKIIIQYNPINRLFISANLNQKSNNDILNEKNYDIQLQGLNVIIMDFINETIPMLNFKMKEGQIIIMNYDKSISSGCFAIEINFYDSDLAEWEPIIELVTLSCDAIHGNQCTPKLYLSIDTNSAQKNNKCNINISDRMIEKIMKFSMNLIKDINSIEPTSENYDQISDEETISIHKINITKYHGSVIPLSNRIHSRLASLNTITSIDNMNNNNSNNVEDYSVKQNMAESLIITNQTGYSMFVEINTHKIDRLLISDKSTTMISLSRDNTNINNNSNNTNTNNNNELFNMQIMDKLPLNRIKISIILNDKTKFVLPKIDVVPQTYQIFELENIEPINSSDKCFYIHSYVYIKGNSKAIEISSLNKFKNITNIKLILHVEKSNKVYETTLLPGDICSLPLTFNWFDIKIKDLHSTQNIWSNVINSEWLNKPCSIHLQDIYLSIHPDKSDTSGQKIFLIEAPFIFTNTFPFDISLNFPHHQNKLSSNSNISSNAMNKYTKYDLNIDLKPNHKYEYYLKDMLEITRLRIKLPGFKYSDPIQFTCNDESQYKNINIIDQTGRKILIKAFNSYNTNYTNHIYFYSNLYLKNETNLILNWCYKCDDGLYPIAGQDNNNNSSSSNQSLVVVLSMPSNINKLCFIIQQKPKIFSEEINIGFNGSKLIYGKEDITYFNDIQDHSNSNIKNKQSIKYEFGVDSSIQYYNVPDTLIKLPCKVIVLGPRYVIMNNTKYVINIASAIDINQKIKLEPGTRAPFYLPVLGEKKSIILRILPNNQELNQSEWNWSGELELNTVGNQHFICRQYDRIEYKYFSLLIKNEKSTLYGTINELNISNCGYKIINECPDAYIRFYQPEDKRKSEFVLKQANTQVPFAWPEPAANHTLLFEFDFKNPLIDDISLEINPDKLNNKHTIRLTSKGQTLNLRIKVKTYLEKDAKCVKFYPILNTENIKDDKEEDYKLQFDINLSHLGISIITELQKKRKELIYANFKNIQFMCIESNNMRTLQLRIKNMQIDNMWTEETNYPVILYPKMKHELDNENKIYFFDLCIKRDLKNINNMVLPSVKFQLLSTCIKLEDKTIYMLYSFMNKIFKNKDILDFFSDPNQARNCSWNKKDIKQSSQKIYINEMWISYVEISISYKKTYLAIKSDPNISEDIGSDTLGISLTNIENAPIKLKGIHLDCILDDPTELAGKLWFHYKEDMLKNLLYVVGSIELIGNPVGLFKHISTGVVDFIEKPIEGFVQGPLEGGRGIILGTGSLIKNTVAGTFNSLNKIAGSMATGLASLSMDDDFIMKRERMRLQKANNIVDGLEQGLHSIYEGFGDGVKSFFTKPIEGASKRGFAGFIKGSVQAISGILVKPMAGILDAASKTAEGLKNMSDEQARKNEIRTRLLRPFYGKNKYFKRYIEFDSQILYHLRNEKIVNVESVSYVESYFLLASKVNDMVTILVIFHEGVVVLNEKLPDNGIFLEFKYIKDIELFAHGLKIVCTKGILIVESCNQEINKFIYSQLNDLRIQQ